MAAGSVGVADFAAVDSAAVVDVVAVVDVAVVDVVGSRIPGGMMEDRSRP